MLAAFIFKSIHSNPGMLYLCYRNGTSYEPEGSVNVSVFLDGTQTPLYEDKGYKFFANSDTGEVSRYVGTMSVFFHVS